MPFPEPRRLRGPAQLKMLPLPRLLLPPLPAHPAPAASSDSSSQAAAAPPRCNITRWDQLCPAQPSQPAECFACCEAHKHELVAMRCEGRLKFGQFFWAPLRQVDLFGRVRIEVE